MSTGPTRNAWLDTVGKDRPPSASPKAGIFVYLYICVYIYIYTCTMGSVYLQMFQRSPNLDPKFHFQIQTSKKSRSYWGYRSPAAAAAEIGRGSFANSDVIRGAVGMQFLMPLLDEFALDACGRTCADQKRVMTIFSKSMEINDQWIDVKFW